MKSIETEKWRECEWCGKKFNSAQEFNDHFNSYEVAEEDDRG